MYNFDYDPTPGTAEWVVDQRIRRAEELQLRRLERMEGVVQEEEEAAAAAAAAAAQPAAVLAEAASSSGRRGGGGAAFASMSMGMGGGGFAFGGGGAFAEAHQGIGRASRAVLNTLSRAARRAPALSSGRPRLARPAARRAAPQQQQKQQQQP
jgi:hypothetical protein